MTEEGRVQEGAGAAAGGHPSEASAHQGGDNTAAASAHVPPAPVPEAQPPERLPQAEDRGSALMASDSRGILDWVAIGVMSLFMSFLAVVIYDSFYRYRVVSVDLSEFLADRVRYHYDNKTPETVAMEDMRVFSNELHKMLKKESEEKKMIILIAPSVIAGTEDITPSVTEKIRKIQSGGTVSDGRNK